MMAHDELAATKAMKIAIAELNWAIDSLESVRRSYDLDGFDQADRVVMQLRGRASLLLADADELEVFTSGLRAMAADNG